MVNAQQWLESQEEYSTREKRAKVEKLNIYSKELGDNLDLSDFVNLKKLDCSYNKIISLDLSNCEELTTVLARDNLLTDIRLPLNPERLKTIRLGNNNFPAIDLSLFSKYTNLNDLRVGTDDRTRIERNIYNRFSGSLEPLKNLVKLVILGVSNTDIDSGLEYLPESLRTIYCYNLCRNEAGCRKILSGLNNIQTWRDSNPLLIITRWKKEAEQAKEEIMTKTQRIKELKDELQMEREEAEKALQKAQEWRERQIKELKEEKDQQINQLQNKISKLEAQIQIPPK